MACMPDPAFLVLHPKFGNLKCGSLAVQASVLHVDEYAAGNNLWAKLRSRGHVPKGCGQWCE